MGTRQTYGHGHKTFRMVREELNDIAAVVNELQADHATSKTGVDAIETLIEELHDDHATSKTAVDAIETLIEELHDDHATFKAIVDDLKTQLNRVLGANDNLISAPALAIGSTPANVANGAFSFRVNGVTYAKAAVAAGTAPGNDVIPQSTYGGAALDIGADGTIDVIEAADNATGYGSAALAIAGIAAVAADHVRMGTVTVTKSDGAFTFGTTSLADASSTVVYTDGTADTAIATSSPGTLTASKPASGPATLTAPKPASGPATLTASTVIDTFTDVQGTP